MSHSQYLVVEIPLDAARPQPEQIESSLNLLGDLGWRVVSLEVMRRLALGGSRVRVKVEQVEIELDPVA